ncbi:hypothetical protein BV898_02762 [Hypsibius exemplaris]|uniref:Receptor ligand binding region domain-containing protein n=1 Tax=Hypsibius exemplaris TaxID=2072580 RepID=A0A1W0X7C3_HYPEX|nr:hypothetical protein BV898_02762 [Hypsibius exemplaris]
MDTWLRKWAMMVMLLSSIAGMRTTTLQPLITVEFATIGLSYFNETKGSLPFSAPSQTIAVRDANQRYGHIFNFILRPRYELSVETCLAAADNAPHLVAEWFYGNHWATDTIPIVLLPGCISAESLVVNYFAASENLLLITSTSAAPIIRDKQLSPTFVSMGRYTSAAYQAFYRSILTLYGWSSVYVLVDDSSVAIYQSVAEDFTKAAQALPDRGQHLVVQHIRTPTINVLQQSLALFRTKSRVMLFCGRADRLRLLMVEAYKYNMTNGDYVYIAMENFIYTPFYGLMDWRYRDEKDEDAREAFASLLLIRPVDFNESLTNNSTLSASEISRLSLLDYNMSLPLADQPVQNFISAYLTISLTAEVLNRSYTLYGSSRLHSGVNLAEMFMNQTFSTEFGEVSLDEAGERIVGLTLSHWDPSANTFQPFLLQPPDAVGFLRLLQNISWVEGKQWPVPNEPVCGYSGLSWRCRSDVLLRAILPTIFVITCLCLAVFCYICYARFSREHLADRQTWWRLDNLHLTERRLPINQGLNSCSYSTN